MVVNPAWAATTFKVTTTADSGSGSLREAILNANNETTNPDNDTIVFDLGPTATIKLGSTLPTITDASDLTIDGQSASITISGKIDNNQVRVLQVAQDAELALSNLTVADGRSGDNQGGGIFNQGTLTVSSSTLSNNASNAGGGISNKGGTLTVSNSTLSGNYGGNYGGGILNFPGGTLTVSDSTFSGNSANSGGVIFNQGTATVSNSTLSGNTAPQDGGGINNNGGTLTVSNSTLSSNTTQESGGGIINFATLTVSNSTLSGNSASNGGGGIINYGTATFENTILANSTSGGNCSRPITDGGYNISSDSSCAFAAEGSRNATDPMLGALADNGGPTLTHALLADSPAIDKGVATLNTDQRGVSRPQGGAADIGAFETEALTARDDPTAAGDPKYSVVQDGELTVSASDGVLANDTDPENDPLTAIKATDPTNGTLTLNSDGSFTYTPRAGFSGTDSFTYKANDGTNDSNIATVTLTVNPETTAPTVSSVTPTKTTGVSRTPNITATFSEQMDKASVEKIDPSTQKSVNVKLINRANGKQVAATVRCDADPCNKVMITPENALKANTKYKAIVSTRVEDLAGNRLDQDPTTTGNQRKNWTFITRR